MLLYKKQCCQNSASVCQTISLEDSTFMLHTRLYCTKSEQLIDKVQSHKTVLNISWKPSENGFAMFY